MNTRLTEPAPPQPRRPEAAARSAVAAAASGGPRLDVAARPSVASAPGASSSMLASGLSNPGRGPVKSDPTNLRPAPNSSSSSSSMPPTPPSVQGRRIMSSLGVAPPGETAHSAAADFVAVEPLLHGPDGGAATAGSAANGMMGNGGGPASSSTAVGSNRSDLQTRGNFHASGPPSSTPGLRPACAAVAQAVRSCSPPLPPVSTAPAGGGMPSEAATFVVAASSLSTSGSPLGGGSPSAGAARGVHSRSQSPTTTRLAAAQESRSHFSGFREQLEQESKVRKVQEYAGIKSIHALCSRVQSYMEQEVQRASENHRSLQNALEHRLAEAQGTLESMFLNKFDKVHSSVVALDDRLKAVEGSYSQACDNYINEMKEETLCMRAESRDFQRRFQDELAKRRETEGAIVARLRDLELRCASDFSNKSRSRQEEWDEFAQEVQASCFAWEEANRTYQDDTMEKVQSCKDRLDEAVRQREEADDDIVAALNQYTQVLQEAVASASRGSLIAVTTL